MIQLNAPGASVDFVDSDERFAFQWDPSTLGMNGSPIDDSISDTKESGVVIRTKFPSVSTIKSIRIKPSRDALVILRSDGHTDLLILAENSIIQIHSTIRSRDPDLVEVAAVHWIANDQLLIITNQGLEFIQIRQKALNGASGGGTTLKTIKTIPIMVRWHRYLMVMCCTSSPSSGTRLQVVQCSPSGNISIWPQFDLNSLMVLNSSALISSSSSSSSAAATASPSVDSIRRSKSIGSLCLVYLYETPVCVVTGQLADGDSMISLFVMRETSFFRTKLNYRIPSASPNNLTVSVVDNLLAISDQERKKTFVFDIRQTSSLEPIVPPFTLPSYQYLLDRNSLQSDSKSTISEMLDIYNLTEWRWENGTDLVYNKAHRRMAVLSIDLDQMVLNYSSPKDFADKDQRASLSLASLLIRRRGAGRAVLKLMREIIVDSIAAKPASIGSLFDQMHQQLSAGVLDSLRGSAASDQTTADVESSSGTSAGSKMLDSIIQALPARFHISASAASSPAKLEGRRGDSFFRQADLPSQHEVYTYILEPLSRREESNRGHSMSVIGEYLRSLAMFNQESDPLVGELLFHSLVRCAKYRQLHNLLQYRVFSDSRRMAELMISLSAEYPPFMQLGMDMLKRLKCHDLVLFELLKRSNIMGAVMYVRDNSLLNKLIPGQFLRVAQSSGDSVLFYNTFRFMEQRNYYLHGSRNFQQSEDCDSFVEQFNRLFPE